MKLTPQIVARRRRRRHTRRRSDGHSHRFGAGCGRLPSRLYDQQPVDGGFGANVSITNLGNPISS